MELILIIAAVVIRFILLNVGTGYTGDINCFKSWSIMLYEGGFSNFYLSDAFTDYPPGYMYILYIVGFIRNALKLDYNSANFTALIKLPAVLCDILGVTFIYSLALKRLKTTKPALLIALAYALNPAVIINSAVWGQVDSVYTLLIIISIYYLTEKKLLPSYVLYAAALLIKPQSLMFAPVYLFSAYDYLASNKFTSSANRTLTQYCAASLGILLLGIIPFTNRLDPSPVFEQYANTIFSYPYASINAYNFYSLLGGNWANVSEKLLFMSYGSWGTVFIAAIAIFSIFLLYKQKIDYFFAAAFINVCVFMFSTRMHERYVFPAIALLTVAYIFNKSRATLLLLVGFSATLYINCADVLKMAANAHDLSMLADNITPFSLINVGLAVFMIVVAVRRTFAAQGLTDSACLSNNPSPPSRHSSRFELLMCDVVPKTSERILSRHDFIVIAGLTFCSAVIAFANLGEASAPETVWPSGTAVEAVANFGEQADVTHIIYLNGAVNNQPFMLSYSDDGINWNDRLYDSGDVFAWKEAPVAFTARYIKVTALSGELMLMEIGFKNNGRILALNSDSTLFDEQYQIPSVPSYRNSTYFDEIYHARTAYEYINSLPVYESTHPPLGKVIISWGIKLFGMNPFGFRVMGALAGALMPALIYLFAKRLCGTIFWPTFAAVLFAVDFMRFTLSRIATVDILCTFFILAAFYFIYVYFTTSFDKLQKLLPPLALSGMFMGLAIAVKWQGVYAGAGMGIAFFMDLYHRSKNQNFINRLPVVLGCCVLFFVAVPIFIYLLAYIPYLRTPGMDGLKSIVENQLWMFEYHSGLDADHSFASPWWQWPLDIRPVFLYVRSVSDAGVASAAESLRESISTMGNPVCWYAGLAAVIYSLFHKRLFNGRVFLLTGYAAMLLPWVFITRCTFIYHYFPCVGFMILLLTCCLAKNARRRTAIVIMTAAIALFIVYYPVLSGTPVSSEFVHKYLEWLPTWQII